MFSKEIYENRRRRLRESLGGGLALFLGNPEAPMNYPANTYHFRQDSSFLYLFGLDFPDLAAVMDLDTGHDIVFGDELTMDDIIWTGPQPSLADRARQAGVERTRPMAELAGYLKDAAAKGARVHYLPPYRAENKIWLSELTGIPLAGLHERRSVELTRAVIGLRSVKEPCEITELELAAAAGYQMHTRAMRMAREGRSEQELAGMMEGVSLAHGGVPSFPIILSQNGQILHGHDHSLTLTKGRMLLVDAGAESPLHYASDNTRTTPVGGRFDQRQRDVYQIVLDANNAVLEAIKPGVPYLAIHKLACLTLARGLKALGLMKGDPAEAVEAGAHAMFMPHGLGHMLGLDVHDMEDLGQSLVGYDDEVRPSDQFGAASLRMGRTLRPGFVITDEPGIYFIPALMDQWRARGLHRDFIDYDACEKFKDFGGVRLEDTVLVTPDGNRILGDRIPISVDEVEAIAATE